MNKPLILIVEDDPPIRNLISVTLEAHEYRYLAAGNAGTAIMVLSSMTFTPSNALLMVSSYVV